MNPISAFGKHDSLTAKITLKIWSQNFKGLVGMCKVFSPSYFFLISNNCYPSVLDEKP